MEMSQWNFIHAVTQNTRASYGTQTWISSDVPCNDSQQEKNNRSASWLLKKSFCSLLSSSLVNIST